MRNLFISREVITPNLAPRRDAVSITSNPFLKETFVLYQSGLIIGVKEETHEVTMEENCNKVGVF